MIVSIIGSGALGKIYGALLALAGHQVHFLVRSEYEALQKAGYFDIVIKEPQTTLRIANPNLLTQSSDLPPSDLVIIALKTTANESIPAMISSCVTDKTVVMTIQNGIGNEEYISQYIGKSPLICAIATIGAGRGSATCVDVAFIGNLKFAPYGSADKALCQKMADAFQGTPVPLPITIHDNYKDIRWYKLGWNIPFGALSILFDQSTHELSNDEPYLTMIYRIMDEIKMIANKEGAVFTDETSKTLVGLTHKGGRYFPTIYRDFHEGNPIEKQYLFDHVLSIGQKHQCITPMLMLLERQLATLLTLREYQQTPF